MVRDKSIRDSGASAFRSVSMTVGGQTSTGGGPFGGGRVTVANHLASIQSNLIPEPIRTLSAQTLETLWREAVGPISGVEKLNYVSQFFGNPSDIAFDLTHQNEDVLAQAVAALKQNYETTPGLFEVQDSNSPGKRPVRHLTHPSRHCNRFNFGRYR